MSKRPVDLVVISDVHLGTYGCHAKELLKYLKSIRPGKVILNGDIIDIWQFSKNYWPESHMKVVRRMMKFITDGIPVYYLTGNHDEMLRKFADLKMGSFQLLNKMVLPLGNEKAWIFHGDVFDITMQHSKWLAKLGAIGYDSLILINSFVNYILTLLKKEKMSFSKKIKGSIKNAVKFMNDFEQTAAELAAEKNYQYVICGHIHHPVIQEMNTKKGKVMYLNSGDWIENLSSLEYHNGKWEIFRYNPKDFNLPDDEDPNSEENEDLESKVNVNLLYENLISSSRNR
jgi:UDP-2,3-diacylglucosamine pyrophosphatase LpxH